MHVCSYLYKVAYNFCVSLDQQIVYSDESPPAYHEVCPRFAPELQSPNLDQLQDTTISNNVMVSEANGHIPHSKQIVLSPPIVSPLVQVKCLTLNKAHKMNCILL